MLLSLSEIMYRTAWHPGIPVGTVIVYVKVELEVPLFRTGKVGGASREPVFVQCRLCASVFTKEVRPSISTLAKTPKCSLLVPWSLQVPENQGYPYFAPDL